MNSGVLDAMRRIPIVACSKVRGSCMLKLRSMQAGARNGFSSALCYPQIEDSSNGVNHARLAGYWVIPRVFAAKFNRNASRISLRVLFLQTLVRCLQEQRRQ